MSHSQYIQEEAARLIVEGRVSLLYEVSGTAIFVVEDETETYRVHLNPDRTVSCTCNDWIQWNKPCLHILASQFCFHILEVVE